MHCLIKIIIILVFFFSKNVYSDDVEKIIFTINKKIFTTIDLDNRIKYLNILTNNNTNLSFTEYENDLVTVLLFNEYALEKNINISDDIINNYYNSIINQYKEIDKEKYQKLKNNSLIDPEIITSNLIYDYQRKIILENLIQDQSNNNLHLQEVELINLYNIEIKYFTFDSIFKDKLDKIIKIIDFKNIEKTKQVLNEELLDYVFYEKKIDSLQNLNEKIIIEIKNNNDSFVLNLNEFFLVGFIIKKLKQNIELKYTFFQIFFDENSELTTDSIFCQNINYLKNKQNVKVKEFNNINIDKLNDLIKNSLQTIGDVLKIDQNERSSYIILCDLKYNEEVTKNLVFNEKLNKTAEKIQKEFVLMHKTTYKFIKYE